MLPPKQARFVEEYLIDLNATQAVIRAGYSAKTANAAAGRLLLNVSIQEAITVALAKRSARTEITQDMVVKEIAIIAFADMGDYVSWGPLGIVAQKSADLPEGVTRAVLEVSESVTEGGRSFKFKLHDKLGALDKLGKHLGMFVERRELSGPGGQPLQVSLMELAKEIAEG